MIGLPTRRSVVFARALEDGLDERANKASLAAWCGVIGIGGGAMLVAIAAAALASASSATLSVVDGVL